ncbi:MAG: exopolyphosphatase [Rhodocyclaceae bacterium]|nr:exopolyphosphatase [Rhodocyclaceae bacterium]
MQYESIAAVDLGSNSFRLEVGRVVDDQIYTLDSLKESVRLASGLQPDKSLDRASQERALDALSRFGERIRGLPPEAVRAVATNALRVAKNATPFLREAEAALGFPIEIIAGREEARLIYIGAVHSLPASDAQRLVFDIGGGSTEFIIGNGMKPLCLESLFMGCVSYSLRYFPDGHIDRKRMNEAQMAAAKEVSLIAHTYQKTGWREAIGSSGTAKAIAEILEQNDLNPSGLSGITRRGLDRLCALMIKYKRMDALPLNGVKSDRIPVLPGGIAIMSAILDTLNIEHATYADGALRLGVLYDLLGRFHHHDMRAATVKQFQRRYQVESEQADRVSETALKIFGDLMGLKLRKPEELERDSQFIDWAASLHEVGLSIAHTGYHKHGAYILSYADMPGFSKMDQARLALLVLCHRGKLNKVEGLNREDNAWRQILSLRLASILHRSRLDGAETPALQARETVNGFTLQLPAEWLAENPMTAAALHDESAIWDEAGFRLRIRAIRK